MPAQYVTTNRSKIWPWLASVVVLIVTACLLRSEGRLWICSCGKLLVWAGDVCSSDNSQHFLDPYSFTHVLHGFAYGGLLAWAVPRLSPAWRLCLAVLVEAMWEVIENSDFIIQRYREATAALGYQGDTLVNSLGDILCCGIGFLMARRLGFRRTLALFVVTEVVLLLWIRDSLLLEVLMLLLPVDAIKAWQMCH